MILPFDHHLVPKWNNRLVAPSSYIHTYKKTYMQRLHKLIQDASPHVSSLLYKIPESPSGAHEENIGQVGASFYIFVHTRNPKEWRKEKRMKKKRNLEREMRAADYKIESEGPQILGEKLIYEISVIREAAFWSRGDRRETVRGKKNCMIIDFNKVLLPYLPKKMTNSSEITSKRRSRCRGGHKSLTWWNKNENMLINFLWNILLRRGGVPYRNIYILR